MRLEELEPGITMRITFGPISRHRAIGLPTFHSEYTRSSQAIFRRGQGWLPFPDATAHHPHPSPR